MNPEVIINLVMPPAVFGSTAFIVWAVVTNRRRQKMLDAQMQMHTRLLDKFGSGQELLSYLQSDAGKTFLESATIEQTKPYGRILGSVSIGIVVSFLGAAFLFLREQVPESSQEFVAAGAIFLALGLGFLFSGAAAYALSKSWGLINGQPKQRAND